MSWSPYKDKVIDYVECHPGCTKWDVACAVTWNQRRDPSKQYYIVNTAIRNGWIVAIWRDNKYSLYLPKDCPVQHKKSDK